MRDEAGHAAAALPDEVRARLYDQALNLARIGAWECELETERLTWTPGVHCQSALEWDPLSASKRDPFDRRVLLVALASSELVGVAETARARVV